MPANAGPGLPLDMEGFHQDIPRWITCLLTVQQIANGVNHSALVEPPPLATWFLPVQHLISFTHNPRGAESLAPDHTVVPVFPA